MNASEVSVPGNLICQTIGHGLLLVPLPTIPLQHKPQIVDRRGDRSELKVHIDRLFLKPQLTLLMPCLAGGICGLALSTQAKKFQHVIVNLELIGLVKLFFEFMHRAAIDRN